MKYKILFPILIIISLNFNSCTNSTGPDKSPILRISEPPTITGFYITNNHYPDGTGDIIGNPAYTIKNKINAFPNPCPDYPVNGYYNIYNFFITFSHLPKRVKMIIVRGRNQEEATNNTYSSLGIPVAPTGIWIERTLEKDDPNQFFRWDLHDENGSFVPKGYYRVYFYGDGVPDNYFLDILVDMTPYLNHFERF